MICKSGSGMSQPDVRLSHADRFVKGLLLRKENTSFHLTYCITASLTISELPVAFALAMSAESVSSSRQYMSRLKAIALVNMLPDAPQTAADI
jgi:hypothetical protein